MAAELLKLAAGVSFQAAPPSSPAAEAAYAAEQAAAPPALTFSDGGMLAAATELSHAYLHGKLLVAEFLAPRGG